MSLFKERQASSRKVIELQNEILKLKSQLNQALSASVKSEDCKELKNEIKAILSQRDQALSELKESHSAEIADLKATLKKLRSENTRLKNKLTKDDNDV